MAKDMKGTFITFEGAEGSGKSTQAQMVCKYLEGLNKPVQHIREPGGVKISESIRRLLLNVNNTQMTDECETLLYMAARGQLVGEVILPELKKGTIVLSDRYLDSTIVYQGYGNGVDIGMIESIGAFATKGLTPDLTFIFDIDAEKGLSRTGRTKDRIELRSLAYHKKVRNGYLQLAKNHPDRIVLIKVNKNQEEIFEIVREHVNRILGL